MTISSLADQLKELKSETNHRATLKVYNLLENNKKTFLQYLEEDSFIMLLKNFENLANENPREHSGENYKSEYKKNIELLMFYLDKII
ncbi:MAG TPA: hypothetical protein VGF30_07075 [Bacteroidia bacterium]